MLRVRQGDLLVKQDKNKKHYIARKMLYRLSYLKGMNILREVTRRENGKKAIRTQDLGSVTPMAFHEPTAETKKV